MNGVKKIVSVFFFSFLSFVSMGQNCVYVADDIYPGSFGSLPVLLTPYGSALYFSAAGNANGTEFWKFEDGNATMVADIYPGSFSSLPNEFTEMGGNLYFTANNGVNGKELWKFDGTLTTMVADIFPGATGSMPENLTVIGSELYFSANNGVAGRELWKYDGTTVSMVADIYPGAGPSNPVEMCGIGSLVFFAANNGVNGLELYKYDGVTTTLIDVNPGATGSEPAELTIFDGAVCFRANDGVAGTELWKYDGTTLTLVDINPTGNSNPYILTVVGSELLFRGFDFVSGYELWKYDGTNASLVMNINPGATNSLPSNLTAVGTDLYFAANDGTNGVELWKYDGTTAFLAADIFPGGSSSMPATPTEKFAVMGTDLFFVATNATSGNELWRFDGTTAYLSEDIVPGALSSSPSYLTPYDSKLYFMANDGVIGGELWAWDPDAQLTSSITVVSCGDYTSPGGTLYSTHGTYNFDDIIPSIACPGCDSTITVDLTITEPSSSFTVVTCSDFTTPGGVVYSSPGNYLINEVIPSIACPGADSTITIDLTISPGVSPAVVVFSGVLVSQQAGADYQWLDCESGYAPIPGETEQDFLPTTTGNYAVEISSGGCIDTTDCYLVIVDVNNTGLNTNDELSINIYPNPANEYLNLSFASIFEKEIRLLDNSGRLIFSSSSEELNTTIAMNTYASGIYFVQIISKDINFVQKIVHQQP